MGWGQWEEGITRTTIKDTWTKPQGGWKQGREIKNKKRKKKFPLDTDPVLFHSNTFLGQGLKST